MSLAPGPLMLLKLIVGGGGRGRGIPRDTIAHNTCSFYVMVLLINFYPSLNFEMNVHRNHRTSSDITEGKTK